MTETNSEISSLLRHLGTVISGGLISKGWIDSSLSESVVGLVGAVGVMLIALWNKRKAQREKAATAAVALALPAYSDTDDLNKALAKESLPPIEEAPRC